MPFRISGSLVNDRHPEDNEISAASLVSWAGSAKWWHDRHQVEEVGAKSPEIAPVSRGQS